MLDLSTPPTPPNRLRRLLGEAFRFLVWLAWSFAAALLGASVGWAFARDSPLTLGALALVSFLLVSLATFAINRGSLARTDWLPYLPALLFVTALSCCFVLLPSLPAGNPMEPPAPNDEQPTSMGSEMDTSSMGTDMAQPPANSEGVKEDMEDVESPTHKKHTSMGFDMGTSSMGSDMAQPPAGMGWEEQRAIERRLSQQEEADPCLASHPTYQDETACLARFLVRGRLAFRPKRVMKQGIPERISIRLSDDAQADLSKNFKDGPPAVQGIEVGHDMKASLKAPAGDFDIRPIGEDTKTLLAPYTDWQWDVTPLHAGKKQLDIVVYAELHLPAGKSRSVEAFVGSAQIEVQVRPLYVVSTFVRQDWQWLLGSPIVLGLGGWLKLRRKRQRRPAGY